MCCLAWIFACFSRISVGIFRRFHWEFSKGFMCVVWLGFSLFFFFGFLLVLKEISMENSEKKRGEERDRTERKKRNKKK